MSVHRALVASALLAAAAGTACARVGVGPSTPAPEPGPQEAGPPAASTWAGSVTFQGQNLPLVLDLRTERAPHQVVTLRLPQLSVNAQGEGSWRGDRIEASLTYDGEGGCPGTIELEARVLEAGNRAAGTLTARDCTGTESGPLALTRRDAAGGPAALH